MNRILLLVVAVVSLVGCKDEDNSSPFMELLRQPPYHALTDSIEKEPKRDELYFRRAILLNSNNLPDPALADFQKAWSLSKREEYAVGVSNLLLAKNTVQAETFLKEALKELPNSILLQLALARSYNEQQKTDEALSMTKTILQQQPGQVNALMLQAELLQTKGDSTGTTTALEKAFTANPRNAEISFKLAYQYAEAKNPRAITLADSLIAMDSLGLFAEPYYIKGVYYSNINDDDKALRSFNETLRRNYNYMNAYVEKGKILLKQKKTEQALETFALANRVDPAYPDAWYWIGQCQEALGRREDAKLSYEKAYELDKTFADAKEAAEKIK